MSDANERLRQKAQNEQTCIALNDLLNTKDADLAAKDAEIERLRQERDRYCALWNRAGRQTVAQPARQVGGGERAAFEATMIGYKAMVEDSRASKLAGRRVEQPSNMFKAWLARAALAPVAVESRDDKTLIAETIGFEFAPGELQTVNANDLLRLVVAARAKSSSTVLMPQRARVVGFGGDKVAEAYNCALDEVARLNRRAIPVELLGRICQLVGSRNLSLENELKCIAAAAELRTLLGKE